MESTATSPPIHPGTARVKDSNRSKVTNGTAVLHGIDQRSPLARRYRDILAAILGDQSGADQCSEARKQLIRRFAAASCLAEALESRLVNGEQIDIAEHAMLSSNSCQARSANWDRSSIP